MSEKLTIDRDKVIAAAEKCPEAEKVLRILFPEVLKGELICSGQLFVDGVHVGQSRSSGNLRDKSFFLSDSFNWKIEKDQLGYSCLVPTRKQ